MSSSKRNTRHVAAPLGVVIVISSGDNSGIQEQLESIGIDTFTTVGSLDEALQVASERATFSTILRSTSLLRDNYSSWIETLHKRIELSPNEIIVHGCALDNPPVKAYPSVVPKLKITQQMKPLDVFAFSVSSIAAVALHRVKEKTIMERVNMVQGLQLVSCNDHFVVDSGYVESGNMKATKLRVEMFPYARRLASKPVPTLVPEIVAVVYVNEGNVDSLTKTIRRLESCDIKTVIVADLVKVDICDFSTNGRFLEETKLIENRAKMGRDYSIFAASLNIPEKALMFFIESGDTFEQTSLEFVAGLAMKNAAVMFGPKKKEFKSLVGPVALMRRLSEVSHTNGTWRDLSHQEMTIAFESRGIAVAQTTTQIAHV